MNEEKIIQNLQELQDDLHKLAVRISTQEAELRDGFAQISDMMDRVGLLHDAVKHCGITEPEPEDEFLLFAEAIEEMYDGKKVRCKLWGPDKYMAFNMKRGRGFIIVDGDEATDDYLLSGKEMTSVWYVVK